MKRSIAVLRRAVQTLTFSQFVGISGATLLSAFVTYAALVGEFEVAIALLGLLVAGATVLAILQQHVLTSRIERASVQSRRELARLVARTEDRAISGRRENRATARKARGVDLLSGDPWSLTTTQWWARTLRRQPRDLNKFVRFAKRVRGNAPLDVLAYLASSGAYNYRQLSEHLNQGVGRKKHRLVDLPVVWWVPGLLAFARTIVAHVSMPNSRLLARLTYDLVVDLSGEGALKSMDRSLYGDLLLDAGKPEQSLKVLGGSRPDPVRAQSQRLLVANALNPALVKEKGDLERWLDQVNPLFAEAGFAPIEMLSGERPSFYALGAPTAVPVESGPLVSVVMPIYEPNDETDVAIASILSQTWRNLELIIVDDGSPRQDQAGNATDYVARLQRWAKDSDRVHLILNEENRGAYWARNMGYEHARGKYLTIADKDDWHHPQRIEAQVARLEGDDSLVACIANWARVTADLRFVIRWGPDRVIHPSFACTMFRREAIREKLGYWDTVRKGADSEFLARMQLAFGFQLEPVSQVPLAFSFLGDGNLTSEDVGMGYESQARRTYREAYTGWHSLLASHGDFRLPLSATERRFPAPADFLPTKQGISFCDVIYVADFVGQDPAAGASTLEELRDLADAGYSVAVVPATDPMRLEPDRPRLDIERLIADGVVTRFAVSEPVTATLAVVRSPRAMHVDQYVRSQVRASHAVVVADQAPFKYTSGERMYDPTVVSYNVQAAFGAIPNWYATSASTARKLGELVETGVPPHPWIGALAYARQLGLPTSVEQSNGADVSTVIQSPSA